MDEEKLFTEMRDQMVREQLVKRNISDMRVLAAMAKVPRHEFVHAAHKDRAYDDGPLPIGLDQTISQPYIVALMSQLLALEGSERVLEIGTGSGYQAAVLSFLAAEVFTVERHAALAGRAKKLLQRLEIGNVDVITMDGSAGLPAFGPYDAIVVTAASPGVPRILAGQLSEGGRLVIPVGGEGQQRLLKITHKEGRFFRREIVPVAFVPLRGKRGWPEEDWAE